MTFRTITSLFAIAVAFAASPAAAQDAAVKQGMAVYNTQKCQICHSIAGTGSKTNPLDGVGTKLSSDDIRQWIVHPDEMTKKSKSTKKPPMPNKFATLPAADIDALVAYMASLK